MPKNARSDSDPVAATAKVAVGIGVIAIAAAKAFGLKGRPARPNLERGSRSLNDIVRNVDGRRRGRRKPPDAGIAVRAVPPKGPLPKTGGAEAPLEFD